MTTSIFLILFLIIDSMWRTLKILQGWQHSMKRRWSDKRTLQYIEQIANDNDNYVILIVVKILSWFKRYVLLNCT